MPYLCIPILYPGMILPEYVIEVTTGTVLAAGTNANVFVTLFGEKSSSVKTQLKSTKHSFDSGRVSQFTIQV